MFPCSHFFFLHCLPRAMHAEGDPSFKLVSNAIYTPLKRGSLSIHPFEPLTASRTPLPPCAFCSSVLIQLSLLNGALHP
ncbi:MAG: hypothetical protein J3Q66DRAFT_347414 [Benniella sp.]|nr:MAG: hypothetical protein J3Q66DRAFT_347414 [Benniella sp.]